MDEFLFHVRGPQAESVAAELTKLIKEELAHDAAPKHPPVDEDDRRAVDPIALAALIISIPGGIIGTWDIINRLRALFAKTKDLQAQYPHIEITLENTNGAQIEITREGASTAINLAIQQSKQ